jgi:single-strand DNA-binding protein
MHSLRNQVTIVGDFGRDPQITTFESGAMVARFSVEIESVRKKIRDRSEQFRMFAWGRTAEFVNQFCNEGKRVAVTGRLVNRTYMSPQGELRRVTEVEVRQVVILR